MNRISSSLNKNKKKKTRKKETINPYPNIEEKTFDEDDIILNKQIKNKKSSNKKIKEKKKKKKKHPILKFFLKLFLLLIIIIGIASYFLYQKTIENGGGKRGFLITILGQNLEEINSLEPINVLLLGVSEDIDTELTDTIILCQYNPKTQTASMLSIPRDTFVGSSESNAKGSDKVNSLYRKGVEKTIAAVEKITNINVDYYMIIKTSTLVKLVDTIGGVNFEVPIDMDYDDPTQDLHIHLSSGMQLIDGSKAEQLLRFRHNNDGSSYPGSYGDNDFGRMKTQRAFIEETVKQTITLKNIFKANNIISAVFDNTETNLTKDIILKYIPDGAEFDLSSIKTEQLPGESKICNELWFYVYDKKETNKLISELFK